VKEEDDQDIIRSKSAALSATPTSEQSPAGNLQAGPFISDLPMRPQFAHPIIPELPTQAHQFVEGPGMGVQSQQSVNPANGNMPLDMVQSPHDTSRRPSIFSDYASPGTNGIYPQQWQPGSSTANTSPMYAYTTTQTNSTQPSFVNHGVPLNQGSAFMGTSFEGSPRPSYDGGSNPMFRANELSQTPVAHSEGYNYLPPDNHHGSRNHMS
jgi:hypothetical protein